MSIEEKYLLLSKLAISRAKITRGKAVAYIEDEGDKAFWEQVFSHFGHKIHYVFYTKLDNKLKTGSGQCLKYKKYNCLSKEFFICIDSDFRCLDNEQNLDIQHFVFQTYTHSIENHFCFGKGLNQQIENYLGFKNTVFDFEKFAKEYSETVFDFFLHFRFSNESQKVFHQQISIRTSKGFPDISENAKNEIVIIEEKKQNLRGFNFSQIEIELAEKGISKQNLYLFLQGHFIKTIFTEIAQKVKFSELKRAKMTEVEKKNLSENFISFEEILKQNIAFGQYNEIIKIENDINIFFEKN